MLEVKHLCKTYRSKDGVSVEATKDISLRFPERGMVFLLGRSGSGKSTLLHLLGGLDRYDSGDILINGTSTKEFTDSMMDSYRNTYVGFVFQDYNILPEFNVGANIALALELQGIRATNERINEMLAEVDLAEYAKRRPNELSGGQLQRVAIARALIKDPDIILADEPTGALDSATGRQVFDTLKKLSKRKLVIIVSHDRDYSEQYADRIIELADGCVISDVELTAKSEDIESTDVFLPEKGIRADKDGLTVKPAYELTEEDRQKINRFLALQKDNNVLLLDGSRLVPKKDRFQATNQDNILPEKTEFSPIKSKLPWKRSFGIGINSLKHKKMTLVFTVLLSVVAFVLFGLADVFYSFDRVVCITDSVWNSEVKFLTITKNADMLEFNYSEDTENEDSEDSFSSGTSFRSGDIRKIEEVSGLAMIPGKNIFNTRYFYKKTSGKTDYYSWEYAVFPRFVMGILELDEERLNAFGATLTEGHLPTPGSCEVCISTLAAMSIMRNDSSLKISDLIGMTLPGIDELTEVKICGIIELGIDWQRYQRMLSEDPDTLSESETVVREVTLQLCRNECGYGLPAYIFCAVGSSNLVDTDIFGSFRTTEREIQIRDSETPGSMEVAYTFVSSTNAEASGSVVRFDGTKEPLKDDEILISLEYAKNVLWRDLDKELTGNKEYHTQKETVEAVVRIMNKQPLRFTAKEDRTGESFRIAGVFVPKSGKKEGTNYLMAAVVSDSVFSKYAGSEKDEYSMLFCRMPSSSSQLRKLVEFGNKLPNGTYLSVNQSSTYIVEELNEVSNILTPVFRWMGIIFAAFSGVLFAVFITNSIIHKKQEIGVLRAVGARSLDVFRIFLCETGVIAAFNWIISSCIVWLIVSIINKEMQSDIFYNITLLHFGLRQVAILFVIAAVVAYVATFLPIWGIARRKPIDVIRDR